MSKFNIAVVGATGNVGREILNIIDSRNFPVKNLSAVASAKSEGQKIVYGNDKEVEVQSLESFDFKNIDIVLSSPGSKISAKFVPIATKAGAFVIDNTSYFRMKKDVPLIIPEVNPEALDEFFEDDNRSNIISNPNCSTIQMLVAIKPIYDASIINRIIVSTYQSVSGAGKEAMDELFEQTKDIYANKNIQKTKFSKQIAFNAIPHIGCFLENGNTEEEEKMINETKKILDPNINVSATCVRVPIFISHAESINLELDSPLSDDEAKQILSNINHISVIDHRKDEGYVTQVEAAGDDKVFISRIRRDDTIENGLNLWVVSDNLRKGAALNAIQIAELVTTKYSQNITN
mgnify:CR=1 FL=1